MLITFFSLVLLAVAIFFIIGFNKAIPSGIFVDSIPVSTVYIDGRVVGKTPYKDTRQSGKVHIKIIPDNVSATPYENDLTLNAGIQTVVKYSFGDSQDTSSGYVMTFDKDPNDVTGAIVVSDPDNAQVLIDGAVKGFSPHKTGSLPAGKHQIGIKQTGYVDMAIGVNLQDKYRLSIVAKLAKAPPPTPSPSPTPSVKTYIEILDTPTGFLRVRTEPATKGEEIAEVKPHEKFLFLEDDPESGWYKIQYSEPKAGLPNGIQGWVSNQYTKKVEE